MSVSTLFPPHHYFVIPGSTTPAAGYQLFTYAAGTSTKETTSTDSTGVTPNANPIVLDVDGTPPNGIYGTDGTAYKIVIAPPTDTDPPASGVTLVDNYNSGDNLRADLASTATDDGTKGYHLVFYPPLPGETNIEAHEYPPGHIWRYIPRSLHDGIRDETNATDLRTYIQNGFDALGVVGVRTTPVRPPAEEYEIYFPRPGAYLSSGTIYCQWTNLNVNIEGVLIADDFNGTLLDFDYAQRRRPGANSGDGGAAAYKRNHRLRLGRVTAEWQTDNPSPVRYDRVVYTFSGIPTDGDTITLNNLVYTFKTTASLTYEIQIGASVAATITNAETTMTTDGYVTVSTTATTLVIEKGASPLSSSENSSVISITSQFATNSIGVTFGNIWDSDITIFECYQFTVGYEFYASAKDTSIGNFGMETIRLHQGRIEDCQVAGRIRQENSAYLHDMTTYSGNWRVTGAIGTATSHYGFVYDNCRCTNNTFFHVDHEPTTPSDSNLQETPTFLVMGNAFRNRMLYSRCERASVFARIEQGEIDGASIPLPGQGPYMNQFVSGYQALSIEDNSKTKENYHNIGRTGEYSTSGEAASLWNVPILNHNNIFDNTLVANTYTQVTGFQWISTSDSNNTVYRRRVGVTVGANYIGYASTIGLCVTLQNLSGDEEFILTALSPTGNGGRPFVRAFDSSNNLITAARSVLGSRGNVGELRAVAYDSSGSTWRTYLDQGEKIYQRFKLNNTNIAYLYVGILGGTSSAEISTMQITLPQDDVHVRVTQSYSGAKDSIIPISDSATMSGPIVGAGKIIWAETAATDGNGRVRIGWRRNDADSAWVEIWASAATWV